MHLRNDNPKLKVRGRHGIENSLMPFLSSLQQRRLQPEIMDDPTLSAAAHEGALRALGRINWFSGSAGIFWPPVRSLAATDPTRVWRLLDIATGGGDVAIRLWHKARRAGVKLEVHAADISPTALDFARARAKQAGANVQFLRLDVHRNAIPTGYDVIISSLFLHHLAWQQARALLQGMRQAAGRMVVVNDLRRCTPGYLLAWLAGRTLTTSPVARVDAPRSVEAAFNLDEIRALAVQAEMDNVELTRHWPCRFRLTWRRS
jgi:2-polyprenyl-3-methyl-5-hydroxy-6-metoxy-1,4-benzoquinol methylase